MTPQRASAGPASPAVIAASSGDIEALGQLIAEAFFPLAPSRWLVPDGAARRQVLPAYFRQHVEHVMAGGVVLTTADRAGAALWLPAGPEPEGSPDGYAERLAEITGSHHGRFLVLDGELGRHHPAGTAHHYLVILAVRPDRQGRGIGTALLAAHHATLDAGRIPAYLEAAGPRSRRLYARHGYADHGGPIRLPDGPDMYPMWRDPQPHQPAG